MDDKGNLTLTVVESCNQAKMRFFRLDRGSEKYEELIPDVDGLIVYSAASVGSESRTLFWGRTPTDLMNWNLYLARPKDGVVEVRKLAIGGPESTLGQFPLFLDGCRGSESFVVAAQSQTGVIEICVAELAFADAKFKVVKQMFVSGELLDVSISPDGDHIAVLLGNGTSISDASGERILSARKSNELWLVGTRGAQPPAVLIEEGVVPGSFEWNRDGSVAAFMAERTLNRNLIEAFVLDTRTTHELATVGAHSMLTWSLRNPEQALILGGTRGSRDLQVVRVGHDGRFDSVQSFDAADLWQCVFCN